MSANDPAPAYTLKMEMSVGSMTDVSSSCMRLSYTRSISDILHPMRADTFSCEMSDDAGLFSPKRGASIVPGRKLTLTAVQSGTTYPLFYGQVNRLTPQPIQKRATTVVEAVSDYDRIKDINLNIAMSVNINPGSLFTQIMSKCAVNSFSCDALYDTIPFAWYADRSVAAALDELVKSGNYQFYQDGAGTLNLKSRYWGQLGTPVNSFDEVFNLSYALSPDQIVNDFKLNAIPRQQITTVSTVAYIGAAIPLAAGASAGFWLSYLDPENLFANTPVGSLATQVSSGDYYADTIGDGTGTNITSALGISLTTFGATAVATVTNSGGTAGYLSRFQLRGYPVRALAPLGVQAQDSSSQAVYGRRGFQLDNALIQDYTYVTGLANVVVNERKEPRDSVTLAIVNDWPYPVSLEMGSVVAVVNSVTGINSNWAVRGARHDITLVSGLRHEVTYDLEFFKSYPWLVLDDANYGALDNGRMLAL